ncbi:MAG: aminodeoxychorismate lyase, partial [Desulfovibrio sp.]|nr:aminodeoxychorismate lyase [Desulfovibrio sp.]
MKRAPVLAGIVIIALIAWISWSAYSFLTIPPSPPGKKIAFDVAKGATFGQIAAELQKKGLVSDSRK